MESDIGDHDHAVKVNKQVLIYQQKAKSKVFADCERLQYAAIVWLLKLEKLYRHTVL